MNGIPINPPRTPIADGEGMVTMEWYRYFSQLQRVVGGPSNPFEDVAYTVNTPSSGETALLAEQIDQAPLATPPQPANDVPDPLPPPTIVLPADDLLYPPRYGA